MDNFIRIFCISGLLFIGMYFNSVMLLVLSGVLIGVNLSRFAKVLEGVL